MIRRLDGDAGASSTRPSANVLFGVANAGVVGRDGVDVSGNLLTVLGVALPALHPPSLSCSLALRGGVPALDSAFILSIKVSMTRKSSGVIGCPLFASRKAVRAADEAVEEVGCRAGGRNEGGGACG